MMQSDPFYQIFQGEIYLKSNYLMHEHATRDILASMLQNLDYSTTGEFKRKWSKNQKKDFYWTKKNVIVCFSDNVAVCSEDLTPGPDQWFDKNTVVITDNEFMGNPQYQILKVPSSYFGIYNYTPANQKFTPHRRFGLSVNRFCELRQLILLELLHQCGGLENLLKNDYVNFNVWDPTSTGDSKVEKIQEFFSAAWEHNKKSVPNYQMYFDQLINHIPIRNHNFSVEHAHTNVYLNLVIETYSSDLVIALSEKIFRALVTPAPWTVYATAGTVHYLKTLGFDVLDDIIDHSYDTATNDYSNGNNKKIIKYISTSISTYEQLIKMPLYQLTIRCGEAAQHNQSLLHQMKQSWPADFARWLPGVIEKIQ